MLKPGEDGLSHTWTSKLGATKPEQMKECVRLNCANGLEVRPSHKFAVLGVDDIRSLADHALEIEDCPDGANTAHALVVGVTNENSQLVAEAMSSLPMEVVDLDPSWIIKAAKKK